MKKLAFLLHGNKLVRISALVLFNVVFGYAIVKQNYYLLFIVIAIGFLAAIIKSNVIPIVATLLIIPFSSWAVEQGFIPMQVMWLPELLSLVIFIKALIINVVCKRKIKLFGIKIALTFIVITFASFLYNGLSIISFFLFLRLLFRFYFLFLAIINLQLNEKTLKLFNNVLVFIFVSQLPLSIIKLFVYGQGERSLGLSSHSLPTIIPLIAIGFSLSFYYFYKKSSVYIFAILGFIGFAIVGEKRGFILYLPVLIAYFFWIIKDYIHIKSRYLIMAVFALFISFYLSARLIPTLNPDHRIWGKFDLLYIFDYGYKYTTYITTEGQAVGRASATKNIINGLYKRGIAELLIGFGPGSILKSMFRGYNLHEEIDEEFGVEYGINGLSWLIVQVGFFGFIIFTLLFYLILRKSYVVFEQEKHDYWKSFGLGVSIFSFEIIVIGLFYAPFFIEDSISVFYFCLAGIAVSRYYLIRDKQLLYGENHINE